MIGSIDVLGILLASVAAYGVGAVWYSPLLFVKPWMKYLGINPDSRKEGMGKTLALGFVNVLFSVFMLWFIFTMAGVHSFADALIITIASWLTFVVPFAMQSSIYEKRPLGLFFINVLYTLVSLCVAAIVLVLI